MNLLFGVELEAEFSFLALSLDKWSSHIDSSMRRKANKGMLTEMAFSNPETYEG